MSFTLIHGRYHGNYRNGKEHANLNGFSGVDPPEIPAKLRKKCHSWMELISEVDTLIDEHRERIDQLKRMRKAFEKARHRGAEYPV